MRLRALALLIAAAFLIAAAAPALADRAASARLKGKAADDAFDASPHKDAALAKAEQRGAFSKWSRDGNVVKSRFASFNLTGEQGEIAGYSYRNGTAANAMRAIFSRVMFHDFTRDASAGTGGVRLTGSVLRVYGTDGLLTFHSNPGAGFRLVNGENGRDVTVLLAPGVTAGAFGDANKSLRVNLTGFSFADHGHIVVSNGTIAKTPTAVTITLPADATLSFVIHHKSATASRVHTLVTAMAKGRLGATGDAVVVDGKIVIQGDDVDVTLKGGDATTKRASIVASGEGSSARVVVVTLNRADFPDLKNGSLQLKLAGVKVDLGSEASVHVASGAAANVTIEKETIVVTVNVPHFSEQEIVVESVEQTSGGSGGSGGGGSGIPGFAPLAALAAIGLVALALRRRS